MNSFELDCERISNIKTHLMELYEQKGTRQNGEETSQIETNSSSNCDNDNSYNSSDNSYKDS